MADREEIERLTRQARAGSRAAFSELARILMNSIVATAYRLTGSREAALDIAQESFLSAWENLQNFRGDAAFESWLYRIVVNKALNYVESTKTRAAADIDDAVVPATTLLPDRELAQKDLRENVLRFMRDLPEQQRVAFELRFYRQMSFEEIAGATGKGVPTVKTNYREAIKKLRAQAIQMGWRP